MNWHDDLIQDLIKCPKIVVDPPREIKAARSGFVKKTFRLSSVDGQHNFNGFITQNTFFPENFSIGLMYLPKDEKSALILLRCNGKHGGTKEHPHHAFFHIHYATAERINAELKPEGSIQITEEYSTLETGIEYFVNLTGIIASEKYKLLPERYIQANLFE